MSDERRNYGYAYLRIRAREPNARGDAVVDGLPFAPDLVRPRGFVFDEATVKKKIVTRGTDKVDLDELEGAITELVEQLRPHTAELRSLRDRLRMRLTVVAYPDAAWALRLTPEAIAWLTEIDAALWIDVILGIPEGTESGPVCGFCKLERPATDSGEELVDLVGGWGPYHGVADARLVMSIDHWAALRIFDRWEYLAAPLNDLGVSVLAGKPWATTPRRDGATAVPILLRRLRKNRAVWRALRSGNPNAIEVRARHWSNIRHAGAWLRRHDLRRMERLGAMFHYQFIPDPKPSFQEDGSCNHCAYVQPWSVPEPEHVVATPASVDA